MSDAQYSGCTHYKRKAVLLAPCCNEFFACRFCHDAVKHDEETDHKKAHTLDRHAVKTIQCKLCDTIQPAGQTCVSCAATLGAYWCSVCVLLDDEDKGQFHCNDCGICRVGGFPGVEHTHCHTCGICVKTAALETHKCLPNAAHVNCTICLESLHASRAPVQFLPCGHSMHSTCLTSFTKSGQHACPLCKRSILDADMQRYIIEMMDFEIGLTPMPTEYAAKRVRILCHDCGQESVTPFHVIALKCTATDARCGGSYNTAKIGEAPDAETTIP